MPEKYYVDVLRCLARMLKLPNLSFAGLMALSVALFLPLGILTDNSAPLLSSPEPPVSQPPSAPSVGLEVGTSGEILFISTASVRLEFNVTKNGALTGIQNRLTGQEFRLNSSDWRHLWLIDAHEVWLGSAAASRFSYVVLANPAPTVMMNWTHELANVTAVFYEGETPGSLESKFSVSTSASFTIRRVFYPLLTGIQGWGSPSVEDMAAIPSREGYLIEDVVPSLLETGWGEFYPGTLSMQFILFYETGIGGFYVGIHDPKSNFKGIEFWADTPTTVQFNWFHYAENISAGQDFDMNYPLVLAGFVGRDWAAGALIYREWALEQWYVEKGRLEERLDIPPWIKELEIAWKKGAYVTDPETGDVVLEGAPITELPQIAQEVRELLPELEHMYLEVWGWSRDGFDAGYPEYYPPREGEENTAATVHGARKALPVGFYFNGRLVDTRTDTFLQNPEYLTVDEDDHFYTESYGSGRATLTAAVACPATRWWKETMVNSTVKAVRDYGVDLIFLDQLVVAPPILDYRADHGHLPGGGSWWWQSEAEILEAVRLEIRNHNPEAVVTSENVGEVYIPFLDAFSSWESHTDWRPGITRGRTAPVFSFVYHGYALQLGNYHQPTDDSDSFRTSISDNLVRGYIPGANMDVRPSEYWPPIELSLEYLAMATELRRAFPQYLRSGTWVTPSVEVEDVIFHSTYPWAMPQDVMPAVAVGSYSSVEGSIGIFLINRVDKPQAVAISLNGTEWGLVAEEFLTVTITPGAREEALRHNGDTLNLEVDPFSYVVVLVAEEYAVLDEVFVSDERANVASTQQVAFHVSHAAGSPWPGVQLDVDDTEIVTNSTGWAQLNVSSGEVGRREYVVRSVKAEETTIFWKKIENPTVIFDRVIVSLGVSDPRVDVGSRAPIDWEGRYEYDGSPFRGTILLNDALAETLVGKHRYTVQSITDPLHGLSAFSANSVDVIFDQVQIILSAESSRIEVGSTAEVTWQGRYLYDNTPFTGSVTFSRGLVQHESGTYTYGVESIVDENHGLTEFISNGITITFDRIKAEQEVQSTQPGFVTVTVTLTYESDSAPVIDAQVTIQGREAEHLGGGVYQVTLSSLSPLSDIETVVRRRGFQELAISEGATHAGNIIAGTLLAAIISIITVFLLLKRRGRPT